MCLWVSVCLHVWFVVCVCVCVCTTGKCLHSKSSAQQNWVLTHCMISGCMLRVCKDQSAGAVGDLCVCAHNPLCDQWLHAACVHRSVSWSSQGPVCVHDPLCDQWLCVACVHRSVSWSSQGPVCVHDPLCDQWLRVCVHRVVSWSSRGPDQSGTHHVISDCTLCVCVHRSIGWSRTSSNCSST